MLLLSDKKMQSYYPIISIYYWIVMKTVFQCRKLVEKDMLNCIIHILETKQNIRKLLVSK